MTLALVAFSAAMGWCGTPYPGWWKRKKKGPPPPPDWTQFFEYQFDPVAVVSGVAGGIIGGLALSSFAGPEQIAGIGLAALAGGRILSEIAGNVVKR